MLHEHLPIKNQNKQLDIEWQADLTTKIFWLLEAVVGLDLRSSKNASWKGQTSRSLTLREGSKESSQQTKSR